MSEDEKRCLRCGNMIFISVINSVCPHCGVLMKLVA